MSLSPVLLRKVELALHEISSGDPSTADQLIKGLKTIDHGQEISEREYERIRLIGAIRQGQPSQALMIWTRLHAAFPIDPSALMGDIQALHVTAPNEVRNFMEALQEVPTLERVEVDSEQAASPLAWAKNVPWGRVGFGTVIAAVAMIAVVIANIGRDDEVDAAKMVAVGPPSGSGAGSSSSPSGGNSPPASPPSTPPPTGSSSSPSGGDSPPASPPSTPPPTGSSSSPSGGNSPPASPPSTPPPTGSSSSPSGGNSPPASPPSTPPPGQDPIELVGRSTVQIVCEISHVQEGETYWWPYGAGSGFAISDEHIMTNRHCVQMNETEKREAYKDLNLEWDGLPSIRVCIVRCGERPREFVAEIVWKGSGEHDDVAILKVRGHGLTSLSVGHVPAAGKDVWAVGYPGIASSFGDVMADDEDLAKKQEAARHWQSDNSDDLVKTQTEADRTPSLTKGIITKTVFPGGYALTDANISGGNSGGPMFDEHGVVVGIATVGFAVADEDKPQYIASMNAMLKLSHVWKLIRGSGIGNRLNWSHLN